MNAPTARWTGSISVWLDRRDLKSLGIPQTGCLRIITRCVYLWFRWARTHREEHTMKYFQIKQLVEKALRNLEDDDAQKGKSQDLVTATKELLSQAEQSFPCVVVIGADDAVKAHCPVKDFEFPDDAESVVVRFRPGEKYEETRHAKNSDATQFIDVQTPELTDRAVVLIPDGLDLTNHAKTESFFPVVACADAIVITTGKRLTRPAVKTVNLFLSMLKHLLSQMGRQQIPLAYLHYSEGLDPDEAAKIRDANKTSLSDMMAESFEFYVGDVEKDAGYKAYAEWVTEVFGTALYECYSTLSNQFIAHIASTCKHYDETIEQIRGQRENRLGYDAVKQQSLHISRLIKSGEYTKVPQRELHDALVQGKHDLLDNFRTIENGSATIYTTVTEIVAAIETEEDAEAALYKVNKLMGDGFVSAITAVFSLQNSRLSDLSAATVTALSEDLQNAGLPAFRYTFSPVATQTLTPAEIKALNPLLPSFSESAFRNVISGSLGAGLLTGAIKTGIEMGWIAGSWGTPIMMLMFALLGAGIGLTISAAMLNSQKKRAIHAEYDKKTRELLNVLSAQAIRMYDEFSTIWTRALDDGLSSIFDAADSHIQDELSKYESFAGKTREELDALIQEYEAYVACLKDILKGFDDLRETPATASE